MLHNMCIYMSQNLRHEYLTHLCKPALRGLVRTPVPLLLVMPLPVLPLPLPPLLVPLPVLPGKEEPVLPLPPRPAMHTHEL